MPVGRALTGYPGWLDTPASFGPQSVATLAALAGAFARWGSLGAVVAAKGPIAGRAGTGKPGRKRGSAGAARNYSPPDRHGRARSAAT